MKAIINKTDKDGYQLKARKSGKWHAMMKCYSDAVNKDPSKVVKVMDMYNRYLKAYSKDKNAHLIIDNIKNACRANIAHIGNHVFPNDGITLRLGLRVIKKRIKEIRDGVLIDSSGEYVSVLNFFSALDAARFDSKFLQPIINAKT